MVDVLLLNAYYIHTLQRDRSQGLRMSCSKSFCSHEITDNICTCLLSVIPTLYALLWLVFTDCACAHCYRVCIIHDFPSSKEAESSHPVERKPSTHDYVYITCTSTHTHTHLHVWTHIHNMTCTRKHIHIYTQDLLLCAVNNYKTTWSTGSRDSVFDIVYIATVWIWHNTQSPFTYWQSHYLF